MPASRPAPVGRPSRPAKETTTETLDINGIFATLIWGSLGWLVPAVLLALAAFAVLVWGYARAPASPLVRVAGLVLKALAIAAVAFCLVEPMISGTRPRPGANVFIVLADDSQSLAIRDDGRARADVLRRLMAEDASWLARLGQDFDVRKYRFAERLTPLEDVTQLTAEGTASSLATALETIARRFRDQPVAGVLVLTDGNATDLPDAEAEQVAWAGLPPVYPAVLGRQAPAEDVRIGPVAVSQTGFEEAPVTIRAEIEADGYDDQKLVVQLLDADGVVLEQQTVAASSFVVPPSGGNEDRQKPGLQAGETEQRVVRFRFRPDKPGVNFYELRASAESELNQFERPERTAEATLANNRRLVVVDRPAGPYRVLYVSGRPNWELKFLRRAVQNDEQVQLVSLVRIAKREPKFTFLGRQGESSNPLYRGFGDQDKEQKEQYDQPVLVRLGTRDETELRDGFPKKAELLYGYHAVILDDLEAGFFTADQLLLLEKFVSLRGGGLLMLGGAESLAEGDYRRTPVEQLLPVYLDRPPSADAAPGEYRLALTREGWLQPWVRLRQTESEERKRLAAMPPFKTLNRLNQIKPGASVLAEVADATGRRLPALVAQRFGAGRTAALAVGDLWLWTLHRKPGEEDDLAKAWRQTVRWLVADVPDRIEIDVRRHERPGEPVELAAIVRSPQFEPMDNARVEFQVATPDGQSHTLRGQDAGAEPGTYTAGYRPGAAGAYHVTAKVAQTDGKPIGEAEAGWTEDPAAEEFRRLAPDTALMERIARASGGEMVEADRLDRFVADLPNRKIPVTEAWVYPLWHQPLALLFALFCLAAEWGLRRYKGLP